MSFFPIYYSYINSLIESILYKQAISKEFPKVIENETFLFKNTSYNLMITEKNQKIVKCIWY